MANRLTKLSPSIPPCLDLNNVHFMLAGKEAPKKTSADVLRKKIQNLITKNSVLRKDYIRILITARDALIEALEDLENRNRVNVYMVICYIDNKYLRENERYLNTEYLDHNTYTKVKNILNVSLRSIEFYISVIHTTHITNLSGRLYEHLLN